MITVWRRAATVVSVFVFSTGVIVLGSPAAQAIPATSTGSSPTGSLSARVGVDIEVTFESRDITFYGSLRTPTATRSSGIAVLLLPGSGPTDRNGNQKNAMVFPNTLAYLADELASHGIPSLRFDKFGSGRTGLDDSALDAFDYGFDMQVDDAEAALNLLGELTEATPARTVVLGHSEGALTALALQQRTNAPGAGLGLLQPLSQRYLDLLSEQINASLDRSVQSGQLLTSEADATRSSLARTVQSLRENGVIPLDQDPLLGSVGLTPANEFLAEADRYDPVDIAAALADSLPVLIACSEEDLNVSCDQVERLRSVVGAEALTFTQLASANHGLGEIGILAPGQFDAMAPLPLAGQFTQSLTAWVDLIEPR
ncbi:alpha/beta hydrolase (plasmid) [Rhodococcus qingshengii]|uniref:alpha/beta hydrolase n=1 Tax=Rhodococcus qingshengii TaxID=334542 RepID=UPI002112C689|nr:alpha/beta fold hydrolase [Rhodococcus qingshengii]UUE28701.1 alpha/beta hydrolase [Rhodococcus qingshengii]